MVKTAGMQPTPRKKKGKKAPKAKTPANSDVEAMPAMAQHAQPTRQLLSLPQLSQFFNSLVQLVPPRFYFDTSSELMDLKHMKKREKELAKAAIKTKGKVGWDTDVNIVRHHHCRPTSVPSSTLKQRRQRSTCRKSTCSNASSSGKHGG